MRKGQTMVALRERLRPTVRARLGRFRSNQGGSVGIIFGFAAIPILFGFGMGLDYVQAARRHEKLNALADAAALSATTPNMMQQTALQAKLTATALFTAQAGQIPGVTVSAINVVVTDTATSSTTVRNVSVTYTAASPDVFAKLVGKNSIVVTGSSVASNSTAPNTNFYVMLDSSPSMAIAATTGGIATLVANTPKQNGCAFACHQTNPSADNLQNPGGKDQDNYALARSLGVTLRIDLVNSAAQSMMDYLNTQASNNHAKYQVASYSFDYQLNKLGDMTDVTLSSTLAKSYASNLQMLTVYKNGWRTPSDNDNDQDTDWDTSITKMNSTMSTPGNGTNNLTDTPQEVLMIVTDGVADEANGGRKMFAMGGATCTAIKARKIRIAVLYTTYNPLPTNSFYNGNIAPFQPKIGPTLQACASDGLYSVVNTDDDIAAALKTLTNKVLTTAHLMQ